jgi:hypothetical protein
MPRYRTLLMAPAEDADALMKGAHALGDECVTFVAGEEQPRPPSGEFVGVRTVVAMELDEPTTQTVVEEAHAIYERIRKSAGLPPGTGQEPVAMSPMNRLLMFDPRSGDFFIRCQWLGETLHLETYSVAPERWRASM